MLCGEATQPNFLRYRELRLILFGGKGGVGKTTCAAATAIQLAKRSPAESFLIVSTDPAHSVSDALAGAPPPNLCVLELDSAECLNDFKAKHGHKLAEIASRGTFFDEEDIRRFLDLSLPGLDELIGFLEIARHVAEQRYRCVVVDTAPGAHTLSLLKTPDLMRQWLAALDALMAKHRYMKKVFTGSYSRDEIDDFLTDLADSLGKAERLLQDRASCGFVTVMTPEALSIAETKAFVREVERLNIPIRSVVANRISPANGCPACEYEHDRQMQHLQRFSAELPSYPIVCLPLFPWEVVGVRCLEALWDAATRFAGCTSRSTPSRERGPEAGQSFTGRDSFVEYPAPSPSTTLRIMLFAGKGGVGKTTLACATALRLAQERKDKSVLLFSCTPAHALATCLDSPVGSSPERLPSGLVVMEIDAATELESLKAQYRDELEGFLASALPSMDVRFDREAMEKIIDVTPPGLDELMALTRAMELLEGGACDTLVIDSAPTGHLLRLLELPELVDQWLKVFFALFLKYERVFRMPKLSERMVALSRRLKALQKTLRDPHQSALYVVGILSELGFQETADLVVACERMGVCSPLIFLNLATPATDCTQCTALHLQERRYLRHFREAFPEKHHTIVYRQGEYRGPESLLHLSHLLYSDAHTHAEGRNP